MMQSIVETYGYWAVLFGTFFEGETFLILGGFAAHRGYLHFPWVVATAFIGSACGDQFFFFMGRRHAELILRLFPSWKDSLANVHDVIHRNRKKLMVGFRFMYGFRTVIPFGLGTSSIRTGEFLIYSLAGAAVWSVLIGLAGYFFGATFEIFINDVKRFEHIAMIAILAAGAFVTIRRIYKNRKKRENPA